MIGVTEPPFTCPRCGHVEMSLTAISEHDRQCAAVTHKAMPQERPGFRDSWFEFRVRVYMRLIALYHMRRGGGKGIWDV